MGLLDAAATLRDAVDGLDFRPRAPYAYNPLAYAWEPHERLVRRYGGTAPREALFVGMNPGHWGMGQTGVPFGDAPTVREWMGVTGAVGQPARPHPKRPVLGFAATRRDPSGARFYGWARARWGTAEAFFAHSYVVNYCPLLFFDEAGANVTPPQLPRARTPDLFEACDGHLAEVVRALRPRRVVGLGTFAEARAREVVEEFGLDATVEGALHPSPANPANNRGWGWDATTRTPPRAPP